MTISDLEVIRFTVPRVVFHNGVVRRADTIQSLTRVATDAGVEGYYFGGGGHGDPLSRDPERVRMDVARGWETPERAREVYGVVLTGDRETDSLAVDRAATEALRGAAS